jgi:hypothetical protein
MSLPSPIWAIRPAHLIILDFITCATVGEQYRLWSSSLWNFLHTPATSSLLGPNILLKILYNEVVKYLHSHSGTDSEIWEIMP